MTNEQLIQKWNNFKDIKKIDLTNVYTALFIEPDHTVHDMFDQFGLTVEQVCQSDDDDDVTGSLIHIDELMLITVDLIQEFLVKTVYTESESDTVLKEHEKLVKEVETIYTYIGGEFMWIKNKLKQLSPHEPTHHDTTDHLECVDNHIE